ncbi:Receptor expression-enhancing protein 6 [Hondaea fermentalgiana]|uniref:Receptor expression-enhancing protein 6 n=1 Tax=Hondaea fermentalgiana TaxID=2315210 RepID=A0A2R5G8Q7_9STRA|nr:Receptor expression-enhancing protein 6 [Hondaea fermentalgiana]|eukprot:GBG27446.1 Receptor expression-enhancing protein 6 [Hondaea fermentalgiana]
MTTTLDVVAGILLVVLVYCLYSQHMAQKTNKERDIPSAGDDGSGEQSINLKLVMGYTDTSMTKLLFAAVLVALLVPIFFGRSSREAAETQVANVNQVSPADANALDPDSGLLDAEREAILQGVESSDVLPVDLESVLVIDASSPEEWSQAPGILRRDSGKTYVLGVADMSEIFTLEQADSLAKTIQEGFGATSRVLGRGKVMVATIANGELYDGQNTILDESLGVDHTLHALGARSSNGAADIVQTAAARCFADGFKCARIVDSSTGLTDATNVKVRQAMLSLYMDAKSRCSLCDVASKVKRQVDGGAAISQKNKVRTEDQEDDDEDRYTEGPSYLKLFILWATRVLGFIYPLAQTRSALLAKKKDSHEIGAWRAYWTIYAALHMLEDILFIRLVYLMPVYIIAKLCFLGWCVFPDPDNALLAYNLFVETVSPSAKKKLD